MENGLSYPLKYHTRPFRVRLLPSHENTVGTRQPGLGIRVRFCGDGDCRVGTLLKLLMPIQSPFRFLRLAYTLASLSLMAACFASAQQPLTAAAQSGALADAPDAESFPSAPLAQPDAFSAWNDMLRDIMRLGMRAASQPTPGSHAANPLDAPLPAGSTVRPLPAVPSSAMSRPDRETTPDSGFSGRRFSASGPNTSAESRFGGPMQSGGPRLGMEERGGAQPGSALNFGSLFRLAGDLGRGLDSSGHTGLGAALGVLPTLGQLTRGGLSLPMASTAGNFRFSYDSPFTLGGTNGSMLMMRGYGSGYAAYDTPHAHSGRFDFSASALTGVGSAGSAGTMNGTGGMGPGGTGGHAPGPHASGAGQSQPSASVSLHLSF